MFTAASVTDTSVRDLLISGLWTRSNATDWTNLPALYNTTDPQKFIDNNGDARYVVSRIYLSPVPVLILRNPAVGAMFAQVALRLVPMVHDTQLGSHRYFQCPSTISFSRIR